MQWPTEIAEAHYCVHIGFDEREQTLLEQRLCEHIDRIAEGVRNGMEHVLVFSDLPVLSEAEKKLITLNNIAEALENFLGLHNTYRYIWIDLEPSKCTEILVQQEHPECIIEILRTINPVSIITRRDFSKTVRSIAKRLINHYPYRLNSYPSPPAYEGNPKRRKETEQYAKSQLGPDRIFYHELSGGSWEWQLLGAEKQPEDELDKIWEGSWPERFIRLASQCEHVVSRRGKNNLIESLSAKWYTYGPYSTHTVLGEYFDRCVYIMAVNLRDDFWFSENTITPCVRASLVRDQEDFKNILDKIDSRANPPEFVLPWGMSWEEGIEMNIIPRHWVK